MGTKNTTTQEQKSNSTQTVAPPSWTMPGISAAAGQVTNALGKVSGMPAYQGGFVAQPNAALTSGASQAYQTAAGMAPAFGQAIADAARGLGNISPVTTGSYQQSGAYDLTPAIQAATAPIWDQLTKGTLPGLKSSALESGAYTGDRMMSVAPQAVIADAAGKAQQLAATIGFEDFNNREARRLQGYQTDQANSLAAQQFNNNFQMGAANALPGLYNSAMGMQSSAGDLLSGANQLETAAQQAQIDNARAAYEYQLAQPFQGLDVASALLARLSGNYGTTTNAGSSLNTTTQQTSGLGPILQGAMGIGAMAAGFPMGAGGAGGLSSLFKSAAPAAGSALSLPTISPNLFSGAFALGGR